MDFFISEIKSFEKQKRQVKRQIKCQIFKGKTSDKTSDLISTFRKLIRRSSFDQGLSTFLTCILNDNKTKIIYG